MELHGLGYLQSLRKGEFKTDEFDFFKQVFGDRPITVFDVGAHRGNTVRQFRDTLNCATLCAFEPNKDVFEVLTDQYGGDAAIRLFNTGVSNKAGQLLLNINKGEYTSSFLQSTTTGLSSDSQVQTTRQVMVPVVTLDEIAQEQQLKHIHILKLDIQGSEVNALKGAHALLSAGKIDLIYSEAYFIPQYIEQPLFTDIAALLAGYGYQLQDIYNPIYGKGRMAWCDAMFVRENFKL